MSNKSVIPASDEIWSILKETNQQIKTLSSETNQQIKETNKGLKKARELFETQWGKLMESLVEGELVKLLNGKGVDVDSTSTNMKGEYKGRNWEIDIVAINGKEVILVEVKTTLKVKDIEHFIKKLNVFTKWRPEYRDKEVYGAVAYLRADENSAKNAERQGLFVIRATGNSASIINKKGFEPKAFSEFV